MYGELAPYGRRTHPPSEIASEVGAPRPTTCHHPRHDADPIPVPARHGSAVEFSLEAADHEKGWKP